MGEYVSDQIREGVWKVLDDKTMMDNMKNQCSATLQKSLSDSLKNESFMHVVRQHGKDLAREISGDDEVKQNVVGFLNGVFEASINNRKPMGKLKYEATSLLVGVINDPLVRDAIRLNGRTMVQEMLNDEKIMGLITKRIVAPIAVPLMAATAAFCYLAVRGK